MIVIISSFKLINDGVFLPFQHEKLQLYGGREYN